MSINPDYIPLVKYENAPFSIKGLKLAYLIAEVVAISLIIVGALALQKVIHLPAPVTTAFIVGGSIGALMGVCLTLIFKSGYHDIYPKGNWKDFLKRDWSDFTGNNFSHYQKWKEKNPSST